MNPPLRRLALTPGEPAGIGPDLCVQLAQEDLPVELVAVADPELLAQRARQLGLPLNISNVDTSQAPSAHRAGQLKVLPVALQASVNPGELNPANSSYVLNTLDEALEGCLQGRFHGLLTGPVHKSVINEAGIHFTGHTEYLAQGSGGYPVMMLATEGLRVALATTHLPLSKVPEAITTDSLSTVLEVLHQDLEKRLGISNPNILVCGLNPHAGENGHLGREEQEVIIPVLNKYRERGWRLQGPLPADTLFIPDRLAKADAVLAMYHDQGLPVLKHMGFGQAVNITLGLPIIRTSVDHGTALQLAGSGQARTDSLRYALQVAVEMMEHSECKNR